MTRSGSIGGRRATSPLGGGNNGYTSSDGGLPPLSSKAHQPLTWQPTTIKKDGKVGSLMAGHSDSMSEEDDEDLSRPWTVVV